MPRPIEAEQKKFALMKEQIEAYRTDRKKKEEAMMEFTTTINASFASLERGDGIQRYTLPDMERYAEQFRSSIEVYFESEEKLKGAIIRLKAFAKETVTRQLARADEITKMMAESETKADSTATSDQKSDQHGSTGGSVEPEPWQIYGPELQMEVAHQKAVLELLNKLGPKGNQ